MVYSKGDTRKGVLRHLAGALALGLLFAFAATLMGSHTVATATLSHIVLVNASFAIQNVQDGLPVPRPLDWSQDLIDLMIWLREMPVSSLLMCAALFILPIWLATIRVLNPTFTGLSLGGAPAAKTPPADISSEGAIDRKSASLKKMVILCLLVGVPLALFWLLPDWIERTHLAANAAAEPGARIRWQVAAVSALKVARWIVLGAGLWTAIHRDGLAGDFAVPTLHISATAVRRLTVIGAIVGLGAAALTYNTMPWSGLITVLARYRPLGAFTTGYFCNIASRYLIGDAASWFGVGILVYAMGHPGINLRQRAGLLALPLAAAALTAYVQAPLASQRLVRAFDIERVAGTGLDAHRYIMGAAPDGYLAGKELAARIGIDSSARQPNCSILLFTRAGFVTVRQNGYTEDALPATADSAERAKRFLESRHFLTALSWEAVKHIYNVAAIHFDTTGEISILLSDLERGLHPVQCNATLREAFYTCATSAANLAQLDRWAAPSHFSHPDRESQRLMGDLYLRFGATDKALAWYRLAEMPASFMTRIETQKPLFRQGRVRGSLMLNGLPLAGVRVGVVPHRMNGLPTDLEVQVLEGANEILAEDAYSPIFLRFHPRPYAFRWVSEGAVTDAHGAFELGDLTQGEYLLIIALPTDIRLRPPIDQRLAIQNPPSSFEVKYESPIANLGVVRFTYSGNAAARP